MKIKFPLHYTNFKLFVPRGKFQVETSGTVVRPDRIRSRIDKLLAKLRLLAIPTDKFIDHVMPTNVYTVEESSNILQKMRNVYVDLMSSVKCSLVPFSRIDTSEKTLRSVVVNKTAEFRKPSPSTITELVLVNKLVVTCPILLSQIQTHDNATLKLSLMTLNDDKGKAVAVAKPLGAVWKFTKPVFLYAHKSYSISIDRALVNKTTSTRTFCLYYGDAKFKGTTGDNFLKFYFWQTELR